MAARVVASSPQELPRKVTDAVSPVNPATTLAAETTGVKILTVKEKDGTLVKYKVWTQIGKDGKPHKVKKRLPDDEKDALEKPGTVTAASGPHATQPNAAKVDAEAATPEQTNDAQPPPAETDAVKPARKATACSNTPGDLAVAAPPDRTTAAGAARPTLPVDASLDELNIQLNQTAPSMTWTYASVGKLAEPTEPATPSTLAAPNLGIDIPGNTLTGSTAPASPAPRAAVPPATTGAPPARAAAVDNNNSTTTNSVGANPAAEAGLNGAMLAGWIPSATTLALNTAAVGSNAGSAAAHQPAGDAGVPTATYHGRDMVGSGGESDGADGRNRDADFNNGSRPHHGGDNEHGHQGASVGLDDLTHIPDISELAEIPDAEDDDGPDSTESFEEGFDDVPDVDDLEGASVVEDPDDSIPDVDDLDDVDIIDDDPEDTVNQDEHADEAGDGGHDGAQVTLANCGDHLDVEQHNAEDNADGDVDEGNAEDSDLDQHAA